MKTLVEKQHEPVVQGKQWEIEVEEKISKKKNPLYCCNLFGKYCNKIRPSVAFSLLKYLAKNS